MDFDEFNVGTVDGRPDTIVNRRGFEPLVKPNAHCQSIEAAMPGPVHIESGWSLNVYLSPVQWHYSPCPLSPLIVITPRGIGAYRIYLDSACIYTSSMQSQRLICMYKYGTCDPFIRHRTTLGLLATTFQKQVRCSSVA